MADTPYYLQYELTSGELVMLTFTEEDDRDGCHISLDMYKANLGAVDHDVLHRIMEKFRGAVVTASSTS